MMELLAIRERTEAREECLSPYAQKSRLSRGRLKPEAPDPVRTCFARDRDRIIHSKSFRRLKHKTQVFIAPSGDHYVTRLTHTLEVAQLARTIARALGLNEDLAEAISLGHDLGHTPFGHVGEEVLDSVYPGGFRHSEQSLRVVDVLENDGRGLNLTGEVRDGIRSHSKGEDSLFGQPHAPEATFEADVVRIADAIAYINHDIGDAIRAGLLTEEDLPAEAAALLGHAHSARVNTMVTDIIENSWPVSGNQPGVVEIRMSRPVGQATDEMRHFMFRRVYNVQSENADARHARAVLQGLYEYLVTHEELLPKEYLLASDETGRRVVDYIAGMTDQYALRLAAELGIN